MEGKLGHLVPLFLPFYIFPSFSLLRCDPCIPQCPHKKAFSSVSTVNGSWARTYFSVYLSVLPSATSIHESALFFCRSDFESFQFVLQSHMYATCACGNGSIASWRPQTRAMGSSLWLIIIMTNVTSKLLRFVSKCSLLTCRSYLYSRANYRN